MLLIDRYILYRFLGNFTILFCLLYVFAVAIDLILNLDNFVEVAHVASGEDAGFITFFMTLVQLIVDFQAPRFFQFFAYLHGIVAMGAMGFTLAQMHRFKELVAVLASGVSLQRIAMPFILGTFSISLMQLINQELFLPRVAPLLLRDIGSTGLEAFEVQFTSDGQGNLLLAPRFDPDSNTLFSPTFIERADRRMTSRRISADEARWNEAARGWELVNGVALVTGSEEAEGVDLVVQRSAMEFYQSEISPAALKFRRYSEFAGMLSLRQISDMLQLTRQSGESVVKRSMKNTLERFRYSRFSSVLVNILVLVITLPAFLLREPANLLKQSVIGASLAIPCMFGAALGMMVDLPGVMPVTGVFMPVFILIPFALARFTFIKT